MGRPLVTACIFCFFCCAHVSCTSHNDALQQHVWAVFQRYGDGNTITLAGFENLLREIKLENLIYHSHNHQIHSNNSPASNHNHSHRHNENAGCLSSESLLAGADSLTPSTYKEVCPVLLSQLIPKLQLNRTLCSTSKHTHHLPDDAKAVWLYSTLSIVIISLCGLLGVAVIPVMQKLYYQQLIQFLVALAVGTLCGDALLHLLPHAMSANHSHSHSNSESANHESESHETNTLRGLVAMLGVVFFYFTEKCLTMIAEWRKKRQRRTELMPRVRVMREDDSPSAKTKVGEKLCKHKYSSYPYCYGEITENPDNHQQGDNIAVAENNSAVLKNVTASSNNGGGDVAMDDRPTVAANGPQRALLGGGDEAQVENMQENGNGYTVIIREHENAHHGHSHTHGHVHSAPRSMSSVAWMVIMGDGLHNFTDGMAIGAAFSANIAGGFSTALAVFCHELPHELGDFAVLLKAGMSAKQAVFYNLLSSVLCFFGMVAGIVLGHDENMSQWVFAAAAGMFLYIALVDMVPELSSSHSKEGGSLCLCLLHLAGLTVGITIMLIIAVYENDLKTLFDK